MALAQTTPAQPAAPLPPAAAAAGGWGGGIGIGNGLEMHAAYLKNHFLLLGRSRYKWWRPDSGPGANGLFQRLNTRSRQVEVAALVGYAQPVGRGLAYAAAGVGYVVGRQLGEYRFTLRGNEFLVNDTHYYAYRSYQALGVPLEIGFISPLEKRGTRLGLSLQANLNPEHSVYCVLLSLWFGKLGAGAAETR